MKDLLPKMIVPKKEIIPEGPSYITQRKVRTKYSI